MRLFSVLVAAVATLLAVVLPRYLGAVIFFLVLFFILGNFIGEPLGLSNIFRDSPGVHEAVWAASTKTSPTLWTSAFIVFSAGVLMLFPCFSWLYHSAYGDEGAEERALRLRKGLGIFLPGTAAIATILILAWARADSSDPVENEIWRALIGIGVGCVMLAIPMLMSTWILNLFNRYFPMLLEMSETMRDRVRARIGHIPVLNRIVMFCVDALQDVVVETEYNRESVLAVIFIVPTIAIAAYALVAETLIPAVALLSLLLLIYLGIRLLRAINLKWRLTILAVIGLSFVLAFRGADSQFKHTFDGIPGADGVDLYATPLDLRSEPRMTADECGPGLAGQGPANFVTALENWRRLQQARQGVEKPKLVMVATSGGAYRAGYWTALVLDKLIAENRSDDLKGIADAVRIITGASGGMVGAAYFATGASEAGWQSVAGDSLVDRLDADIYWAQRPAPNRPSETEQYYYTVSAPIPRDSLSAISQHLIQHDLGSLFTPGTAPVDRGKVLEKHWYRIDRGFDGLTTGEKEGWRPSMILSPMIIETGQPLVISNLDLSFLPELQNREMEDFFSLFPCTRTSFSLATAVRMNATFPYVSPAISLPTRPQMRIVDAGYYDNYGVALINALLSNNPSTCSLRADAREASGKRKPFCFREWVEANTSGILLIEIRAFRLDTLSEPNDHCPQQPPDDDKFRGFEFLTSPISAALAARGRTMVFRNEQGLRRLNSGPEASRLVRRVTFVNCAEGTLNWVVPQDEMQAMQDNLDAQWPAARQALTNIWQDKD